MDEINQLPDCILVEIFENLSPRMIKCCALVCKRWKEIIGISPVIMDKFVANLRKWEIGYEKMEALRRYDAVLAGKLPRNLTDKIRPWNLKHITLTGLYLVHSSILINMLEKVPNLKSFLAPGFSFTDRDNYTDQKVCLLNLQELSCTNKIAGIFDVNTLRVLKLKCNDAFTSYNPIKMIQQQNNLQELDLYGTYSNQFFHQSEIYNLKCHLISFLFNCDTFSSESSQFIKFLKSQEKSLESLELYSTDTSLGNVQKFVLRNLTKLKKLKTDEFYQMCLHTEEIALEKELTQKLEEEGFEILRAWHYVPAFMDMKSFGCKLRNNSITYNLIFCLFKNLQHLDLKYENFDSLQDALKTIFSSQNDLLSLKVPSILCNIQLLPKLKELSVEDIPNKTLFMDFIKLHSKTLEKIEIKNDGIDEEIADEIFKCTNLSHLIISRGYMCRPIVVEKISAIHKPFKVTITYKEGFKDNKTTFIFPDDKYFWDEEYKDLTNEIDFIFYGDGFDRDFDT